MENENKKKGSAWSIVVIIILVLIALYALFGKKTENKSVVDNNTPTSTIETVNVSIDNGSTTLNVAFNNNSAGTSTVTFVWDGTTYTLPVAMSGSGARYSDSFMEVDKGWQLWEHQGEITISNDGVEVFKGKEVVNQ